MRHLILAAALLTAAAPAFAQQQPHTSATASFAGALATNLATVLAENEALRARVATLEAELKAAKPSVPTPHN